GFDLELTLYYTLFRSIPDSDLPDHSGVMKHGFLSQKESGRGKCVKKKNTNASNLEAVKDGVVPSVTVAYGNTPKDLNDNPMAVDETNAVKIGGEWIDVVVPVELIRAINEKSSYARVMIELRADVELKDNIVVAMPKIIRERCSIGPKVGFKPHKEYKLVPKKSTASPTGNKKKGVTHTNEVSNLNPFDVLNSVDNDEELECSGDYDSEDGVASVDNDMARSLVSERVGSGTQSLLEQ
nr:hypothetical protein [Tanacetum cinerariifolium]